jgi:hypothetical protein
LLDDPSILKELKQMEAAGALGFTEKRIYGQLKEKVMQLQIINNLGNN